MYYKAAFPLWQTIGSDPCVLLLRVGLRVRAWVEGGVCACVRGWRAACVYCDRGLAAPKHPHAGTIRWPWCGRDFAPGPLWQDLAQALVAGCCHWHCAFMLFVFVALCVSGYASEMLSARVAISGHPAPLEHLLAGRQHRVGGATRGHPYISLLRAEARNCPINRVHHSHVPAGLMASRMSHSG